MGLKRSIAVVVIALAVPLVYVAASAHPADRNEARSPQAVEVAQAQPSPRLLASPAAPKAKKSSSRSHYSYGYDDAESFAIVSGKSDSVTMSGTELDGEHLQELKKKIQGDFIWFRRGEKSYIVRDQATIDRARALWAPQEELGKKQEELGKQQEALGKQQEELGKKMEEIRVKVPDMTKEIENLQAKLKQLNSSATVEQIGEIQSEIGELQSQIGEIQSQAGEEQSKLGEEMGALGERQGELGEKQGELGRRQGDLAEQASRETQKLLNESISKGTAQLEQ